MPALTLNEENAFFEACSDGHLDAAARFLDKSPESVNLRNTEGWTPLFLAVQWAHNDMVELLLERGADMRLLDGVGRTALDQASQLNFESISDIFRRVSVAQEREAERVAHAAEVEQFSTGLQSDISLPRQTLKLRK